MATAKKVASKKTAKKAVKKTATKRAYNRKPKVADVETLVSEPADVMAATDTACNAAVQETATLVQLSDYGLWDLREMPRVIRILFLLELESLGYLLQPDLRVPSESAALGSNSDLIEIVKLNHTNKLISFAQFGELELDHGVIAEPIYLESRLDIFNVRTSRAAPTQIVLQGETFVRV